MTTRLLLSSNRTYYVRPDGNDKNNGLTNDPAGAFLNIQKAIDTACNELDIGPYTVKIQVADGNYTSAIKLLRWVGSGAFILQGNVTTPSSVVINTTNETCITYAYSQSPWIVAGFKLGTTISGSAFLVNSAALQFNDIDFSTCASVHIDIANSAYVSVNGNWTISGNAPAHLNLRTGGVFNVGPRTVTLSGTPAFASGFVVCRRGAQAVLLTMTFIGSATGPRYNITLNGVVDTGGGGATYLPGNAAGTTASGGQYA